MGQRDVRRVPLDFDAPLGVVWKGYITPDEFKFPTCSACGGEGYGPEALAIASTFYAHMIGGYNADKLAWNDKLGQAEVDNLVERGRLQVWRDREWRQEPRTAESVNAENRPGTRAFGHDAVNRMILVSFRCKQLGITEQCPQCEGHGTIATQEQRDAAEAWEWTEPPTGDGWQLWETTSEGSPVSPVFDSPQALARWCEPNATVFAGDRASYAEWLQWITNGEVDLASTMAFRCAA